MREFDTTQANLQPEHTDTDEGPIQYNRKTGQWEPITIDGQRVGLKSMSTRWFPGIKQVALDGSYKYPDETIAAMPNEEFYEFD